MTYKETPNKPEEIERILHPIVKKWFFSRFKEFSLPQRFGVMEIHSRKNILVSAPTGATKTLTAFLSILNELIDSADKGILQDRTYCIYVSPLRALSNDIEKNLVEPLREMEAIAGKKLGIRVGVRTGDTTPAEKTRMLKKPPHILITTPESLAIVLSSIKFIDHLKEADWLIIDEIHALAENKRGVHLSLSVERLHRLCPHLTRVGLSATVAPLEEIAKFLVGHEDGQPRDCSIIDVQFIKDMDLQVICPVPDLINTPYEEAYRKRYEIIDDLIQQHRTTLIFTNTRAATERVVDYLRNHFPKNYTEPVDIEDEPDPAPAGKTRAIGAHHGSLSKEHRFRIEEGLRQGKLKAVVTSTSLELGIDIGYIDLVICIGSPKSVARFLQRAGRAGHRLHETVKARIIVTNQDDLVECAILQKNAVEKKIDRIHIPKNALDVLAQQIYGIAIAAPIHRDDLFRLVTSSHCYADLPYHDFLEVLRYLSGEYASLESRHIYAKIWVDEETGMIGRRGKMARVIYMTNIGTIPDETRVRVKIGDRLIGTLDEGFLERLHRGDVFVLGGASYEFRFSRGMTIQVVASAGRPPTIPAWFSEMLPLSFDLAQDIGKFRKLMDAKLKAEEPEEEIVRFIHSYLRVDDNGAKAIHGYFREQYDYAKIPNHRRIIIEHYRDEGRYYCIFHSLYGRRVNDCLSRAVAYAFSRLEHRDVEVGISDNGFYLASPKSVSVKGAMKVLKAEKLDLLMEFAIDRSEVLRRRFRHCATRSLMILRNYKGRTKRVGRQQISSQILINALKRISKDFSILKEARREVLEDLMDIDHTREIIQAIDDRKIQTREISTTIPSPFAFHLILQGHTDLLRMEDRMDFLRRMHSMIQAKISLEKGKQKMKRRK
ncbi:MAG: ATP-dependent helicase [DPANN group archaeon]|nr:ATP-dependent helicase [DPANN group archaeon]